MWLSCTLVNGTQTQATSLIIGIVYVAAGRSGGGCYKHRLGGRRPRLGYVHNIRAQNRGLVGTGSVCVCIVVVVSTESCSTYIHCVSAVSPCKPGRVECPIVCT